MDRARGLPTTMKMKHAASFQTVTEVLKISGFSLPSHMCNLFHTSQSNPSLANTGRISGSTKTSLLRFCLFSLVFNQDEVSDISRRTQKVKQQNFFYYFCCTVLEVIGLISSKKSTKLFKTIVKNSIHLYWFILSVFKILTFQILCCRNLSFP